MDDGLVEEGEVSEINFDELTKFSSIGIEVYSINDQ